MSSTSRLNKLDYATPPVAQTIQQRSLWVGLGFGVLAIIGAFVSPGEFFPSYLIGYMLWLGASLGCMVFLMLQHLTGGNWAMVIRRILEAGSRTLWLMAVLFIPLIFGMHRLYVWTNPAIVAKDEHLRHITGVYLATPYFLMRAALSFIAWGLLVYFLQKWSDSQDNPPDKDLGLRFRNLSGPGLVVYGLTMTFASVDWVMSIEPNWASTIYSLIFIVGQAMTGIAIATIAVVILAKYKPMQAILKPANLKDYGNLMLTWVMVWAYFSFSQWLIIWAGNLPDETSWYLKRLHGGWNSIGTLLMIFQFSVPFALLLSRSFKQNPRKIALLAGWLLVMRWLDLLWVVEPSFHATLYISWLDIVVPVAIGGFWLWLYWRNLQQRPLIPLHDVKAHAILGTED